MALNNLPSGLIVPGSQHEIGMDDDIPLFDLQNIDFPPIQFYGFDHAKNTARLAIVILAAAYPEHDTHDNREVLYTAAMFHDTGRGEAVGHQDPDHAMRSAAALDRFLRSLDFWHGRAELRENACRLVAHHHESAPEGDPLAASLADADALESARVFPGQPEGLTYWKEHTAGLVTPWAKDRSNQKIYMRHRGWKL